MADGDFSACVSQFLIVSWIYKQRQFVCMDVCINMHIYKCFIYKISTLWVLFLWRPLIQAGSHVTLCLAQTGHLMLGGM